MLVARELTLPLMMEAGSTRLVATLIFDLQTNGNVGAASAVGLMMVIILMAMALLFRHFAGGAYRIGDAPRRKAKPLRTRAISPTPAYQREQTQGGASAQGHTLS